MQGVVRAKRYVPRRAFTCVSPTAPLFRRVGGTQETELLFGERFDVLEERDGYAWGQAARDGHVGWVAHSHLLDADISPSHWVSASTGVVIQDRRLPLNAFVTASTEDGLRPVGSGLYEDPVAVAKGLVGAPYLWGGRTHMGVDCSGLVQAALFACGRACPRDSDQQEAAFGRAVEGGAEPRRGDLAFWDGHVGWMADAVTLLHANSFHGEVVVEPLTEAVARRGGEAPRLRRP